MKKYNKPTIEIIEMNLTNVITASGTLNHVNQYGDNATENITPENWMDFFN